MSDPSDVGNDRDAGVVEEICGYLAATPPRSFFLFAGAGSGKTRTLVEVLRRMTGVVDHDAGGALAKTLRARNRAIRVITFTRNAVDIINGRLGDNALASVSTIHSFCWELICGFDHDIREVLLQKAEEEISELEAKAATKKLGKQDQRDLDGLCVRRDELKTKDRFTYSPERGRQERGALTHSDVLAAATRLLDKRETLQAALAARYPIILIDESQDTMKGILTALIKLEASRPGVLALGLLGDHRQRIYQDGHADLPTDVPTTWAKPALQMNHRSQERIVRLINTIWKADLDARSQSSTGVDQHARTERTGGTVRVFVGDTTLSTDEKIRLEARCAELMLKATGDAGWEPGRGHYKVLALEHTLAARRGGFEHLFNAARLIDPDAVVPQGSGENKGPPALRILLEELPALHACRDGDGHPDPFAVISVLNQHKRLASKEGATPLSWDRMSVLDVAAQKTLNAMATNEATIRDVLGPVLDADLFEVHDDLVTSFRDATARPQDPGRGVEESAGDRKRRGWCDLFATRWSEVARYRAYLQGDANVATHQVVKGSEFERVMVVMDDQEARGFLFAYEKLMGAASPSKTDHENVAAGKETSVDRTVRLLYVTCSRARESLALVLWSKDRTVALANIRKLGWFSEDEIVDLHAVGTPCAVESIPS